VRRPMVDRVPLVLGRRDQSTVQRSGRFAVFFEACTGDWAAGV